MQVRVALLECRLAANFIAAGSKAEIIAEASETLFHVRVKKTVVMINVERFIPIHVDVIGEVKFSLNRPTRISP